MKDDVARLRVIFWPWRRGMLDYLFIILGGMDGGVPKVPLILHYICVYETMILSVNEKDPVRSHGAQQLQWPSDARMLNTDPETRYTISKIRTHPWWASGIRVLPPVGVLTPVKRVGQMFERSRSLAARCLGQIIWSFLFFHSSTRWLCYIPSMNI